MDLCFHEYFAFSIEVIMYLFQYDHLRLQIFIDTDFRAQIVYICSIYDYFESWKVSLFSNVTKSVPNSNIFWSRSSLHVNLSNQKGSSIRIEKYEFVKWHNCDPLMWYLLGRRKMGATFTLTAKYTHQSLIIFHKQFVTTMPNNFNGASIQFQTVYRIWQKYALSPFE